MEEAAITQRNLSGDVQMRDNQENVSLSKSQYLQVKQSEQATNHTISYRPDIDGLRTIAIVLVIIYHSFPRYTPGGFIGVDVFFVISGYLISKILIKQNLANKFSYIQFYSRRIRRIYPALILVLVFVLVVVFKNYEADEAEFSFQTLESSVIFGANIQILRHQKNYFDPDINTNPLLHLWSLGVQQQFYIVWPFIISMVVKFFKNNTLLILGMLTVSSFVFSLSKVYINQRFAFYFPLCRFWQMAIGGIIAFQLIQFKTKFFNNILSLFGTLAIIITAQKMDEQSVFPGYWALLPTIGSGCIILASNEALINKHILSSRLFVFVGKISYSLYLWHWPLLVFSKYLYPPGSTSILGNTYFMLLLTVLLSILTYYILQDPIRKKKSKKIVILLFFFMLVVGFAAYACNISKLEQVKNDDQFAIKSFLKKAEQQMKPGPDDYVEIKGRRHSNPSKNKNRKFPTVQNLKVGSTDLKYDQKHGGELILQKKIDESSKYFKSSWAGLNHYQIANEGKQNLLLLVGDSHLFRLTYRFQQLYRQSVAKNQLDNFPTIVAMVRFASATTTQSYLLQYAREFIKQFKPKRLLIGCHWLTYYGQNYLRTPPNEQVKYKKDKMIEEIADFVKYVKEIQSMGVQVTTFTIDIDDQKLSPNNLFDKNGVITNNLRQPLKLSYFRKRYHLIIDELQNSLKNASIPFIDFSDNLCYDDECMPTTPSGHGSFTDNHHIGKLLSRHWLSAVDYLTQF